MYKVLAFYDITPVANPEEMVAEWHRYFKDKDVKGRIYIAHEGINAQMSCHEGVDCFDWIKAQFPSADIKIHVYDEHPFARLTIKVRKQLVALDRPVDFSMQATHATPQEWNEMLKDQKEETIVLDVRNGYEWEVGHFVGAEKPHLDTFREFDALAEQLAQTKDKNTRILMCCTGGIRCEFFSPLLKERGFNNLFQLKGGIIGYGLHQGNELWEGNLFVFDDRMVVPLTEERQPPIAKCHHCGSPSDTYYNCACMDCNELFISCPCCAEQLEGCCSEECVEAPKRRPFNKEERVRPYRRLTRAEKEKL
ncbi:MAG: rhodanese-related sulfurtransferase [Simkaniaceae bacterium]|nr:rhodanese-related sulfurtransferase [Simkaniaceae bacterium]